MRASLCLASLFLPFALTAPAQAAVILPENTTDLTLTSAPVLGALGVSVSRTGTAKIDTSGTYPLAMFPITGGVENADGSLVIDHKGSDLELSKGTTSVDIGNFVVDTKSMTIDGFVAVDGGSPSAPLTLFDLSKGSGDFVVTLSSGAATALNTVFGTDAFSSSIQIGTATTNPVVAAGVPEASTWVLLCAGFGALAVGAARRRSRDMTPVC